MHETISRHQAAGTTGLEIAVIGMAGQFPGARDIKEFWENLKNGVESVSFFSAGELEQEGVGPEVLENPDYVKAGGFLTGKMRFDASFFGYSPREAELMVPQMRFFHECAWSALEDAAYVPGTFAGRIGLYCGASSSTSWEVRAMLSGKRDTLGSFAALTYINKDQLSTRISYNLNLRGPALVVQTACSTGLVAIHLACQGLLSGECDMALAGAVTIFDVEKRGYLYQEGGIYSPDGHCRTFDAGANGSVAGEGGGVVVLKPLEDATAANDHIYAIIKGSAINNDGRTKVGYTAPSGRGQASVIDDALTAAEVQPASISYIETHGTATAIGDPIEMESLKSVFRTLENNTCPIGSVKTNFGHLLTAAGIAGFIKTVLALKYRQIPPSLHFQKNNPKIDPGDNPFYVNRWLQEWKNDGYPLRAGVSSFGIGGTNAHVVLDEFSEGTGGLAPLPDAHLSPKYQFILLSAKTETALEKMTRNLAAHFRENPGINLADAAYTLQVGREVFNHRKTFTCSSVTEAVDNLSSKNSRKAGAFTGKGVKPALIFMFSGLGAQYVNMGYDLYKNEPVFREEMDRCFEILNDLSDYDIKEILYPFYRSDRSYTSHKTYQAYQSNQSHINQTEIAQLVIFIFEYALARLLMEWGIQPRGMIGYSFGEYAVACLSGVFSPEDALKLLILRGQLIGKTSPGRMLSVPMPREELQPLLVDESSVCIAIDNGPSCIIAGEIHQVKAFEKKLQEKKYLCFPLQARHAIHSNLMAPIAEEFEAGVRKTRLNPPHFPYISNLTGDWIKAEEAIDPGYWSKHLQETVQFGKGIKQLLREPGAIFVEIGPGRDLCALIQRYLEHDKDQEAVNLVRTPEQDIPDVDYLWSKMARLWLYGTDIDWSKLYGQQMRKRISLPAYPFEGEVFHMAKGHYSLDKNLQPGEFTLQKDPDIGNWTYTVVWEQSFTPIPPPESRQTRCSRLVFIDEYGLGTELVKSLRKGGGEVIVVKAGNTFRKVNHRKFIINPKKEQDYERLLSAVPMEKFPHKIIHLWCVTGDNEGVDLAASDVAQDRGFFCIFNIARAIGKLNILNQLEIEVVTDNMHRVTGEEVFLCPEKATLLGAVKVIPLEYANIKCRNIDIVVPPRGSKRERLLALLEMEFHRDIDDIIVAYRGDYRWKKSVRSLPLEKLGKESKWLREKGVYLITGGFGGMGLSFAQYLSRAVKAKLILVGRKPMPPQDQWEKCLITHADDYILCRKIRKLQEIVNNGSQLIMVSADVSHPDQMQEAVTRAEERFGPVNGILHTAGVIDFGGVFHGRTREDIEEVLAPKVKGTLVLEHIFKDKKPGPDFFIFFSSAATIFYQIKYGQGGYVAANDFLDAFGYYKQLKNDTVSTTIGWTDWKEVGMSVDAYMHERAREGAEFGSKTLIDENARKGNGMFPAEGVEAFCRIMDNNLNHLPLVAVAPFDLVGLMKYLKINKAPVSTFEQYRHKDKSSYSKARLSSQYEAPRNELERKITDVWEDIFGFEEIGIHDDFFEMGGDSLLAITFANRFKELLGEAVYVTVMFDAPTIARLAAYFSHHYPEGAAALVGEKTGAPPALDEPEPRENLEELLARVDELPEGEVDALLNKILHQEKGEQE